MTIPTNKDRAEKNIADFTNRINALENKLALLELQAKGWRWGSGDPPGGLIRATPNGWVMEGQTSLTREIHATPTPIPMLGDDLPDFKKLAEKTLELFGSSYICGREDRRYSLTSNPQHEARWRPMCFLRNERGVSGSGTLISPRCVLTCAHVIIPEGIGPQYIDVVPCQYVDQGQIQQPFGWKRAYRWNIHPRYVRISPDALSASYDVGVVILPDDDLYKNIGSRGAYGIMAPTDNYLQQNYIIPGVNRKWITSDGYPMDRPLLGCLTEVNSGNMTQFENLYFQITSDIGGGQSGSPIYEYNFTSQVGTIIGLISIGRCPSAPNLAKRIDPETFQIIAGWVENSHLSGPNSA